MRPISTLSQLLSNWSVADRYPRGQIEMFSLALWGPYVLKSLSNADEEWSWLSLILPSEIPKGSKQVAKIVRKQVVSRANVFSCLKTLPLNLSS